MANSNSWMWEEALAFISSAERLHRRFFEPSDMRSQCHWEPPVDLYERDGDLTMVVALPGAAPASTEVSVDTGFVRIRGARALSIPQQVRIRRLEIPYGVFERRVALPPGRFQLQWTSVENGCLTLELRRIA